MQYRYASRLIIQLYIHVGIDPTLAFFTLTAVQCIALSVALRLLRLRSLFQYTVHTLETSLF